MFSGLRVAEGEMQSFDTLPFYSPDLRHPPSPFSSLIRTQETVLSCAEVPDLLLGSSLQLRVEEFGESSRRVVLSCLQCPDNFFSCYRNCEMEVGAFPRGAGSQAACL